MEKTPPVVGAGYRFRSLMAFASNRPPLIPAPPFAAVAEPAKQALIENSAKSAGQQIRFDAHVK